MSKLSLTLDGINLLINSEEPKNTELYGNLYETLIQLNITKAVTIDNLFSLDNDAKGALTYCY